LSGIHSIEEDYGGRHKKSYHTNWTGDLKTSKFGSLIDQRKSIPCVNDVQ